MKLTTSTYYPTTYAYISGRALNLRCSGFVAKDVPANTELTIGTLPEKYRPTTAFLKYGLCGGTTGRLIRIYIGTDGKVTYTLTIAIASGGSVNINETFVV